MEVWDFMLGFYWYLLQIDLGSNNMFAKLLSISKLFLYCIHYPSILGILRTIVWKAELKAKRIFYSIGRCTASKKQ